MRIAYFINQYPKVSHSFIRREINALESQGVEIMRIALRGWDAELVDERDIAERGLTHYVLKSGVKDLLIALIRIMAQRPKRFLSAVMLAIKMGVEAVRPLPYHLIYLAEACKILHWVEKAGIKHIHGHFGTNTAEILMLANALGGPTYSFTVHGPEEFDKPQFFGIAEKIRRAAFVIAISSYGRSQLYRWVEHEHWNKVRVVHCGLEEAFINVEIPQQPDNHRFVCVGRLCEQKGQLLLIEAARQLAEDNVEFELVLAGDGEMRGEIESLIGAYSLDDRISITGWISSDRVMEEILASRAMILPSFAEGLPVVLMESLALKRPVLTTYVAGIPELVKPGKNGWLFPAGSVDAIVEAMKSCLTTPKDVLQAMGENGRSAVLDRHSIDKEAGKLKVLLQNL
ncbi:MAG: glycosyltransferase [Candidatus Sedimenticola sp. (ex Thyasira tokunagai)]